MFYAFVSKALDVKVHPWLNFFYFIFSLKEREPLQVSQINSSVSPLRSGVCADSAVSMKPPNFDTAEF